MGRAAAPPPSSEAERRSAEAGLLHLRLDLNGIRGYQRSNQQWQPFQHGQEELLVVNLWAVECVPCVAELPVLRIMVQSWSDQPKVRFLFISETLDEQKIVNFWHQTAKNRVPDLEVFQSTDNRIRATLGTGLQPLTLILDSQYMVRQAFIGSLAERRFEVSRALTRLAAGLSARKVPNNARSK